MKKQRLSVFVHGFLFLFLFYSCSVEENIAVQSKTELIENTKKWFDNTKESQNLAILKHTKIILWEKAIVSNGENGEIVEVPIILEDNKATSIGTIKELKDYHRLLFAKDKNNNFRSYDIQIFTNEPNFDNHNENFNFYNVNANFNGTITIFDGLEERTNFLNFKSSKKTKPKLTHKDSDPMSEEYLCTFLGYLYADGTFEPFAILSCIGMGGGIDLVSVGSGTGTYGGGGSATIDPIPEPIPIKTLCDNLKEKQKNLELKTKLEVLRNKTNLHYESGFAEKLDGIFIDLKNNGDNSLEFPIENNIIGFNHNHNDDYETDIDGGTDLIQPIRMFSPADLKNFHILIYKAYRNGITFDKIYGNMVINSATYTLTFAGDINSVLNSNINYDNLGKNYEKSMKSDNKAEALLLFMKNNIGIEGINLTKTDLSGNISVLTLDINNKLTSIPCN